MKTKTFTTRAGKPLTFSALGTGTAPLGNLYAAIDEDTAQATLAAALTAGVTYFDTAPLYGFGLAERRLGTFLRRARPDALVSTKVGRLLALGERGPDAQPTQWFDVPNRDVRYDYSYDGVMRSFEFSLERMGRDRFDILYCHDIDVFTHKTQEAADARTAEFMDGGLKALMELRAAGLCDAIGLGVNAWEVCQFVGERADVDLFLLAGRYTLLEQEALKSFLPLCAQKGMGVVIGGPFNSGILATGAKAGAMYNYLPAPGAILERVARIEAVAGRHGVRLADAALAFPLAHPQVVSVIPGAVTPDEVGAAVTALSAKIPSDFWAELTVEGLLTEGAPIPG
ncbi:MAG: aldo/keto reductase [Pseudomonadota bacterium]